MSSSKIHHYFVTWRDVAGKEGKEGPFVSRPEAETWAREDSKRKPSGAFRKYYLEDNLKGTLEINTEV